MSYEKRKILFENLKILVTSEYEEIYRIIKRHNQPYTENSNGIFFNIMLITEECFADMEKYMQFCIENRSNENSRIKEMAALRGELKAPTQSTM
jgi:hypothetical protein